VDPTGYRDKYICSEMVADALVMFGSGPTVEELAQRCGTTTLDTGEVTSLAKCRTLSPHELRLRLDVSNEVRPVSNIEIGRHVNSLLKSRGLV
jgi:hypothetical protein